MTNPLKIRRTVTTRQIMRRIVDTGSQLILTSPEEMLEASTCGTMAPDIMERFLRTVKGTLDPDVATSSLLSILLMRAIEKVEMECVECEEDNRYIIESNYADRYELFIHHLRDMAKYGPFAIAQASKPSLTGMDMQKARLGSRFLIITGGWDQIWDAVQRFNAAPLD